MDEQTRNKLNELLKDLEPTQKNLMQVKEIKELLQEEKIVEAKELIDELYEKVKKQEELDEEGENNKKYPDELSNEAIETTYIGLLLNNPKFISKYYIIHENCYFENEELLNVYKSIIFFEGAEYSSEEAKDKFNFSKVTDSFNEYKDKLKKQFINSEEDMEGTYIELYKLFVLRKNLL